MILFLDFSDFYDLAFEIWLSLSFYEPFWVARGVLRMRVNSILMISLMFSLNLSKLDSILLALIFSVAISCLLFLMSTLSCSSSSSFWTMCFCSSELVCYNFTIFLFSNSMIWACFSILLCSCTKSSLSFVIYNYFSCSLNSTYLFFSELSDNSSILALSWV